MEFTLNTMELQQLVIALIYAQTDFENRGGDRYKELAETASKLTDLFASVNAKTREENDYNATFNVTF